MIRVLVGTAFAGLLLAGCNTPPQTAPAAAASAAGTPRCRKLVEDTGSHMLERKTVCDNGPGAGALEGATRRTNQGTGDAGR